MPASLVRLRIAGFKSFAEPATVEILPGLTGIVGPNGCGKSNVVEALRWAMGEGSARSLRGAEMDDVIFAGTAQRPSRNVAEVTIGLEQTQGLAPPPFQDAPELQVARRIERGAGSMFRINGHEARARDVQTLFADLATGARASAMVSQGRVGALVAARPEERRALLEEAAGITGLHARRHEAELKLRAAEANLARADDLRAQMAARLEGLRRQAKQAARARDIGEAVRAAECELLATQRALAERRRAGAQDALAASIAAVLAATAAAAAAATRAAAAAAALPPLRETEAACRTELERARLQAEQMASDAARASAALAAAAQRRAQARRDLAYAEQTGRDAVAAVQRLVDESARLDAEAATAPERMQAAEHAAAIAAAALHAAEVAAEATVAHAAEATARQRAAAETLAAAGKRARRMAEQAAWLEGERRRAQEQAVPPERLAEAARLQTEAEQALVAARVALDGAEAARATAQQALAQAREQAQVAEATRTRLAAAAQGLAEALGTRPGERVARMVDQLVVPAGLEAALAAALGEALEAAADTGAPRHWRELPPFPPGPLPTGAAPLADLVQAPAALARALSLVGVVDDAVSAEALQPALGPGQALVSRDGALWRSDGFCIRAGAPSAAAMRLQQRNRLAGLQRELAAAETASASLRQFRTGAESIERAAAQAEQQARVATREAERRANTQGDAAARLERAAAAAAAQLAAIAHTGARLQEEVSETEAALATAQAAYQALPDANAAATAMELARTTLAAARAQDTAARAARDSLTRADAARTQRRRILVAELADWRERAADAVGRAADLTARAVAAEAEHATLSAAPAAMVEQRAQAQAVQAAADATLARVAEALRAAESAATEAERTTRAADAGLATAREAQIRAESLATQADHAWGSVAERIAERLGANPDLPDPPAALDDAAEERLRRRLERLQRERDGFGPVNQRAEIEAAETEAQVAVMEREGADLATAIAKLRGSIGHINREGRERLGQVFADIDRHFRSLFETMFGGGRAHLALVGSDDPLLAGLEIYAQPPGKKLATLSLLSGGEQALTALSLVFAVFRCNPAPVCVLDEVDAPLDDANVERFCDLLEVVVRDTGTRFLVVTHHQLTMARMHRLYGVTMQERGVSRLLSVDLSRAVEMVDAAERLAAE